MGKMDSLLLRSKFRGSLLGALMGDCLGSAYEGDEIFSAGMKLVIQRSFDKLEGPYFKAPVMQFTDDSAMTHAVAESLIQNTGFNQNDMAKKFVKSYFKEPNRGYGSGVTTVFRKLRNNKFIDVLGPAREQFNGEGSLGNGGAMRVAPVALFCHKNYDLMVDVARQQSQITHTHKTGVDGAILQAITVHQSLSLDPETKLDTCKFTEDLIKKMDKIEVDEEGLGLVNPSPYKTQLELLKDLICEEGDGPHEEKVVHHLGTDISALHSVPTAIYCFLRSQKPVKDIQTDNPLRRTIQYAHEMSRCNDPRFISNLKLHKNVVKKWSENEIFKLVNCYKNFPCLWRRDISTYTDNVERHCAYRSIHQAMNMRNVTFTDIMLKIREIRRSYVNELKKTLIAQGAGYKYQPKTNWFDIVHEFLCPNLDYDESAELHDIDCSISKSLIQRKTKQSSARDPRHEGYCLHCEEQNIDKVSSSVLKYPQDFESPPILESSNCSRLSRSTSPLLDNSTGFCQSVKNRPPPMLLKHIPPHINSLRHSSTNILMNPLKAGVQFSLSNSSIVSDISSSSTIVCEKRSDYTCTPIKLVKECGVQWTTCSNSKQSSSVSCDTSSVEKGTRDSSILVEYDEHDIFGKTIASHLRLMDVETAHRVRNQIEKVITDHRLHKPETISLGGDTDTIASMAGAIAGAFYGEDMIRPEILKHCEISSEFRDLADKLYEVSSA